MVSPKRCAGPKSATLQVAKRSAAPLIAASSTISSSGSLSWGRHRNLTSTGSIIAARLPENASSSSSVSPCRRRCSGRFSTSSYSRNSGGEPGAVNTPSASRALLGGSCRRLRGRTPRQTALCRGVQTIRGDPAQPSPPGPGWFSPADAAPG